MPARIAREARLQALALSFRTLADWREAGVAPYDPAKLDEWASGPYPSSGALHAARFVLHVEDPAARWRAGPFNLKDALTSWDDAHFAAFLAAVQAIRRGDV